MRTRLSLFWAAVRWTLFMFVLTPLLGAPDFKREPVTPAKPIRTWDGLSSWYGPGFHGRQTANGEIYDMYAPTAAHPTLPLGSVVRVVNKRTGRSRVVRINDRGPYIEGREIDVSYGVARSLGFHGRGVAKVRIELLTVPKPVSRVLVLMPKKPQASPPQPSPKERLIVALDFPALAPAMQMAERLAGNSGRFPGLFKVGSELFTAIGPASVVMLEKLCRGIFLDLKFHDIPNTVAGAVRSAAALPGVRLINVHALGGLEMMQAAAESLKFAPNSAGVAAAAAIAPRPKLLAVTILTSMDDAALRRIGIAGPAAKRVVALAKLAQRAGLDGVVCSPLEVRAIRRACGPNFLTVVPGIRPAPGVSSRANVAATVSSRAKRGIPLKSQKRDDQSRIATPADAIRAGAHYIVVGRPITSATDPLAATSAILNEISSAL